MARSVAIYGGAPPICALRCSSTAIGTRCNLSSGRPHILRKPICNAVPSRISMPYRDSTARISPPSKVKNSLIASALNVGGSCVRPKNCRCQCRMVGGPCPRAGNHARIGVKIHIAPHHQIVTFCIECTVRPNRCAPAAIRRLSCSGWQSSCASRSSASRAALARRRA